MAIVIPINNLRNYEQIKGLQSKTIKEMGGNCEQLWVILSDKKI